MKKKLLLLANLVLMPTISFGAGDSDFSTAPEKKNEDITLSISSNDGGRIYVNDPGSSELQWLADWGDIEKTQEGYEALLKIVKVLKEKDNIEYRHAFLCDEKIFKAWSLSSKGFVQGYRSMWDNSGIADCQVLAVSRSALHSCKTQINEKLEELRKQKEATKK